MRRAVVFVRRSSELLTAVVAVVAMWMLNIVLQDWFQAGSFDMVILLKPFFFLYELFILHAGLWLLWKMVYPSLANFLDVDFKKIILSDKYLTIWQKVIIVTVLWSSYLLFLALLVAGGIMN